MVFLYISVTKVRWSRIRKRFWRPQFNLANLITKQTTSKAKKSRTFGLFSLWVIGSSHSNVNGFKLFSIGIDANECTGQDLSDLSSIGFTGE